MPNQENEDFGHIPALQGTPAAAAAAALSIEEPVRSWEKQCFQSMPAFCHKARVGAGHLAPPALLTLEGRSCVHLLHGPGPASILPSEEEDVAVFAAPPSILPAWVPQVTSTSLIEHDRLMLNTGSDVTTNRKIRANSIMKH